ncbi:MAG: PEP-CTERM sorting domain-containing protein [Acidobacteriaceae bacterium]|nr:PEP-CTERM sorting domain-containing protein [Acidobacteriaceae bacterium]
MKFGQFLTVIIAGSTLAAVPAFATSVSGIANWNGTVRVIDTASSSGIFFSSTSDVANQITAGTPNTGSFAGLTGGTIQNLTGPPVTGSFPVTDFITFNTPSGNVFFDLMTIEPGSGTAAACTSSAVGSQCTPANSPFTLIQTSTGSVTISLNLRGVVYSGTSSTGTSATLASFSTQSTVPGTIPQILVDVSTVGITDSYSANLSATAPAVIPEPASLLLMGVGLLGAALVGRRKIRG